MITAAAIVLVVLIALLSCAGSPRRPHSLRVGYLPNITHAVPMVAEARGFLPARSGTPAVLVPFNDGPSAIEALLANDIDAAYCGPGPAINAFVRTNKRVRILAGAASGGAAFIVRDDLKVATPADFAHAKLATPQTGNSQDIALRHWLREHDLESTDRGGTVMVVPMANSQILSLFLQKQIDGAWVPEPWATRLVREGRGRVFLDEASLWPDGRYPTTVLVAGEKLLLRRPQEARALVRANRQAVLWINRNPVASQKIVNEALEKATGKKLPEALLQASWRHLVFTDDPLLAQLKDVARAARRIGYMPSSDLRGLVVDAAELERREAAK